MTDDLLFKAIADPTRRRLLDVLRQSPATTGALCAHFPEVTRFAVMKHLNVLEEAGLVSTRKAGRERWYELEAAPLRQLQDGWLAPYDGEKGAPVAASRYQARLHAPRRRVYEVLTRDVAAWWPETDAEDDTLDVVLEAALGGQFKRIGVAGGQDLWAIVTGLHPGRRLELQGSFGLESGSVGRLTFLLDDDQGGTHLTVTAQLPESFAERVGDGLVAYLER